MAEIHSSYDTDAANDNTVSLHCGDEEGSCLKTMLFANTSATVNIECVGGGSLRSKLHSPCDGFHIFAQDASEVNLVCSDDFSCFDVHLHAESARSVHVGARGDMALSSSYIYAQQAEALQLSCGSERSEVGCYKLYTFNPEYASPGAPRTSIVCQGHGCREQLYFESQHGMVISQN